MSDLGVAGDEGELEVPAATRERFFDALIRAVRLCNDTGGEAGEASSDIVAAFRLENGGGDGSTGALREALKRCLWKHAGLRASDIRSMTRASGLSGSRMPDGGDGTGDRGSGRRLQASRGGPSDLSNDVLILAETSAIAATASRRN